MKTLAAKYHHVAIVTSRGGWRGGPAFSQFTISLADHIGRCEAIAWANDANVAPNSVSVVVVPPTVRDAYAA